MQYKSTWFYRLYPSIFKHSKPQTNLQLCSQMLLIAKPQKTLKYVCSKCSSQVSITPTMHIAQWPKKITSAMKILALKVTSCSHRLAKRSNLSCASLTHVRRELLYRAKKVIQKLCTILFLEGYYLVEKKLTVQTLRLS